MKRTNHKNGDHFDPKGKQPTEHTIKKWQDAKHTMAFEDKQDFIEMKKGFLKAPDYRVIKDENDKVVWDMEQYEFLFNKVEYKSIHPSLQRQAMLNMNYGLYEVVKDNIYQVRGFDLANITFIKGKTGWIVFDPLTCTETAKAAYKLFKEALIEMGKIDDANRKVKAVIYSHSHADHFGGVKGVITPEDANNGNVEVIAPKGFLEHAISENVHAGNAMSRRMFMQYGLMLDAHPCGHVDQAIGKNTATGELGLIEPNVEIVDDYETREVDGIEMVFQNTPGTEAPAEMNTYIPHLKAFWAAENIVATIHNIYTLRGALVRDALLWSKKINEALYEFGQKSNVMFTAHSWPRWTTRRIQEVMKDQRDMYANLNNGVLHLANKGVTINEIHNEYKIPETLEDKWHTRSYHGSVKHNSRAVINRYLGYWDANPATLIPLSPYETAPLYVDMMGGSTPIIYKAKELYRDGQYLMAVEILNKLAYARPENQEAKDLLADCYEQIGYQQESTSLRNSFLAGANELRNRVPKLAALKKSGLDMVDSMTTELWLEYIGVKVDNNKAKGLKFIINLTTEEEYPPGLTDELNIKVESLVAEMSNSTFTVINGYQHNECDLKLVVNRKDIVQVMKGETTMTELIESGKAEATVNPESEYDDPIDIINDLESTLVNFRLGFEILPGTKAFPNIEEVNQTKPLQVDIPAVLGSLQVLRNDISTNIKESETAVNHNILN